MSSGPSSPAAVESAVSQVEGTLRGGAFRSDAGCPPVVGGLVAPVPCDGRGRCRGPAGRRAQDRRRPAPAGRGRAGEPGSGGHRRALPVDRERRGGRAPRVADRGRQPRLDGSHRRHPHASLLRPGGLRRRHDVAVRGAVRLVRAVHWRHRVGYRGAAVRRHGVSARGPARGSDGQRRHCRRRQRGCVRAADRDVVPLHRGARGRRLSRTRRVRHRSADGPGRAARQGVRADAVRLRLRESRR